MRRTDWDQTAVRQSGDFTLYRLSDQGRRITPTSVLITGGTDAGSSNHSTAGSAGGPLAGNFRPAGNDAGQAVEAHDRQHAAAADSLFVSWPGARDPCQGRAPEPDRQHKRPDGLSHSEAGLSGRAYSTR